MNYDTLPYKSFCKIILNEKENLHLLGIEDKTEAKKAWDKILDEWKERNPSQDEKDLARSYRDALLRSIRMAKTVTVAKMLLMSDDFSEEDEKELMKSIRAQWSDDPVQKIKNINKMLSKAKDEKDIYDARLKKLSKEIKEKKKNKQPKQTTMADVNKAIASLELAGFTIDDYESLTCGKYDAMTEILHLQNMRRQSNGNR